MKQIVIAGAGPAGLTAACRLLQAGGFRVTVLEEDSIPGGISRTEIHHGNRIDIGGHRFFSKNPEVNAFWKELLPLQGAPASDDLRLHRVPELLEGGPDPEKEDSVMLSRTRVSRIYYLKRFFDYPISMKLKTVLTLGLARTFLAGMSYLAGILFKRPEKSLEDFYINRFGKRLYRMFFERYTEKLWGVHPREISPAWGAQRVKGLSLLKALSDMLFKPFRKNNSHVETSLINSFHYPKHGPGQLWETAADRVLRNGGDIRFGEKVVRVETENHRVVRVVSRKDGREFVYPCDYFYSSMPVKDLAAAFSPEPPENVRAVSDALPYRDFITVGLLVRKLAVQNRSGRTSGSPLIPDCWIYIQEPEVKLGRLQIFNNWSPYMPADAENSVWLGLEYFCSEGDSMWNMPDRDFIAFAVRELEQIGIIHAPDVLDSVEIRVKKAYPAYFGAYERFHIVRAWLDSFENLFCIGRNGQHRYNNMDHSMLTAMEAVRLTQKGSTDRTALWNVNTEESYHETK